jgi:hypothetical protein
MSQHNRSHKLLGRCLENDRGVAFLFQAYLIAFWMMMLIGAMMMRSNQELQAARLAIEQQQSFWIAEMGMDETVYHLKLNPPTLTNGQCTIPILRLVSQSPLTTENFWFLGTDPFTTGKLDTSIRGYTVQICRRAEGEYQLNFIGITSPRTASMITTVADVPNLNLRFKHALFAPQTITVTRSTFSSVPHATDLVQGGTFQPLTAGSILLGSQAHLGTLGDGVPGLVPRSRRQNIEGAAQ